MLQFLVLVREEVVGKWGITGALLTGASLIGGITGIVRAIGSCKIALLNLHMGRLKTIENGNTKLHYMDIHDNNNNAKFHT